MMRYIHILHKVVSTVFFWSLTVRPVQLIVMCFLLERSSFFVENLEFRMGMPRCWAPHPTQMAQGFALTR